MSDARSKFLSHAAIYLVARGLPGVLAFLAIPVFSRLLTPDDYGRYALVIATAELLNALLFQWARLSMLRYNAVYRDDPGALRSTLLTTTLLTNLVVLTAGLGIWAVPALADWRSAILACCLVVSAQSFYELVCEQARAAIRPWHYMLLQVMRSAGFVGLGLAAVMLLGWSWWGPLAGLVAGMTLAIALSMGRHWRGVRLYIDRAILARVARYGLPLGLTVALAVVISTCDRYLLVWFIDSAAAGVYAAAFDFTTQTLTLLMLAINMAAMPLAIRAYETEGPAAARTQMNINAALLMAVGLPAVIGVCVLVRPITENLLGEAFRAPAVAIMPLVAIGAFLASFKAYHFDAAFQFAHRTIYQVWIVLFVAIVNIGLNLLFIPLWGLVGSAFASVLAYILSIGLTIYFGRRQFVLPFPWTTAAQVSAAAAVMAAALWPFRHHVQPLALGLQVAGGALVYAGGLLMLNFLGLREALMRRISGLPQQMPAGGGPLPASE